MLGAPATTEYDLRFRMLGIPVRVHPLFWLLTAAIGFREQDLPGTFIWVGCAFISILVHEYGHGLMARLFGFDASIVLYGMGGLCYSDAERQSPGQRLAVLISGPGAGFVLAALTYACRIFFLPPELSPGLKQVYDDLLFINIVWGVINLLPIWPLDGGQIAGVLFSLMNRNKGMQAAHIISLLTGGLVAMIAVSYQEYFVGIMFGYLAFMNYQVLHQLHEQARYAASDADDWWRR